MNAGGGGGGRRAKRRGMSEINVTPLVDVMLVLLVIFIVTAPNMKDSIQVDLPKSPGGGTGQGKPTGTLAVSVDTEGRVHVLGSQLSQDELVQKLPGILKDHHDERITIKASKKVPFEAVARVMYVLQSAGFKTANIAFDASKG